MGRIIWHHFLRIMIISHSECPFNVLLMPCEWPLAAASVPPLLSALFEVPNSAVNDTFVTACSDLDPLEGRRSSDSWGRKQEETETGAMTICEQVVNVKKKEWRWVNRLIRSRRLKTVVSRARLSQWYRYDAVYEACRSSQVRWNLKPSTINKLAGK